MDKPADALIRIDGYYYKIGDKGRVFMYEFDEWISCRKHPSELDNRLNQYISRHDEVIYAPQGFNLTERNDD